MGFRRSEIWRILGRWCLGAEIVRGKSPMGLGRVGKRATDPGSEDHTLNEECGLSPSNKDNIVHWRETLFIITKERTEETNVGRNSGQPITTDSKSMVPVETVCSNDKPPRRTRGPLVNNISKTISAIIGKCHREYHKATLIWLWHRHGNMDSPFHPRCGCPNVQSTGDGHGAGGRNWSMEKSASLYGTLHETGSGATSGATFAACLGAQYLTWTKCGVRLVDDSREGTRPGKERPGGRSTKAR